MTSAVSQERYFYLWPRFSIKYWRWTSKDSFWWHYTEWWLCWSWKWHSAVWWGVSSVVCKEQLCFLHPAFSNKTQSTDIFVMGKLKDTHITGSLHPPTPLSRGGQTKVRGPHVARETILFPTPVGQPVYQKPKCGPSGKIMPTPAFKDSTRDDPEHGSEAESQISECVFNQAVVRHWS